MLCKSFLNPFMLFCSISLFHFPHSHIFATASVGLWATSYHHTNSPLLDFRFETVRKRKDDLDLHNLFVLLSVLNTTLGSLETIWCTFTYGDLKRKEKVFKTSSLRPLWQKLKETSKHNLGESVKIADCDLCLRVAFCCPKGWCLKIIRKKWDCLSSKKLKMRNLE